MRTPVTAALVAVTVLAGVTIRDLGFVVARVSSASFVSFARSAGRARSFTPVCS